jgi:(1->4)-alpha-D-glucan 1-alpha-D-glucosylmutase
MSAAIPTPVATYRVQFGPGFGLDDAVELVPYLKSLGVSTLYASPIFRARSGSEHGYDVVDPTAVSPELGGRAAFDRLIDALNRHSLDLMLDIAPNHMAAHEENPWWRDALARGPHSRWSHFFDIDWRSPDADLRGKVLLPILGEPPAEAIRSGALRLEASGRAFALRYHDRTLPLRPESQLRLRRARGSLASSELTREILDEQFYRLERFATGQRRVNYRRFFQINELVGLRQEDERVFAATHALVGSLIERGAVGALRVDHIDGLFDPLGYLNRLRRIARRAAGSRSARPVAIVVEKILGQDERLRPDWPVEGTTGYEFGAALNRVFIDSEGFERIERDFQRRLVRPVSFEEVLIERKRRMILTSFSSELRALARRLERLDRLAGGDCEPRELSRGLIEFTIRLPVYRTYVRRGRATDADRRYIRRALDGARLEAPRFAGAYRRLEALARELSGAPTPLALEFWMKWQQFTGPIVAKGLEDTTHYVYCPLVSLNEVGAEPRLNGDGLEAFHRFNRRRIERGDRGLSATATHDSKRGEDARARLNALSEMPEVWSAALDRWSAWNARHQSVVRGRPAPDALTQTFIYQNLLAVWPAEAVNPARFRRRFREFTIKAIREAQRRTSWIDPDPEYEEAVTSFTDALLDASPGDPFIEDFLLLLRPIAFLGVLNSLSQTLLKIVSPGSPDFYQGTELWNLTLVDPDNRRRVDFEKRRRLLQALDDSLDAAEGGRAADPVSLPRLAGRLLRSWRDGRVKLFALSRALRVRARRPRLFLEGEYLPLEVSGGRSRNLCALARRLPGRPSRERRSEDDWAVALAPRFMHGSVEADAPPLGESVWRDTEATLPPGAPIHWTDAFTGRDVDAARGRLPVADALGAFTLALLLPRARLGPSARSEGR